MRDKSQTVKPSKPAKFHIFLIHSGSFFYKFHFKQIYPLLSSTMERENRQKQRPILVTGASGYIALHCVQQLLTAGFPVRGTVRSLGNAQKVDPLLQLRHKFAQFPGQLELVEADLECAEHWPKAVAGCSAILHVASPWPIVADEGTIRTAVEGTMNVLRAAAECREVRKVVMTSSCAAINDGHRNDERVFDEHCWTDLQSPRVDNYALSKTLAEKAAWEFWHSLEPATRFQLVVLNPTFVTGPVLSSVPHGSAIIIGRIMAFLTFPAAPKVCLGVVDVRDVARAHLLALQREDANGQRVLITHDRPVWFSDMAKWLRREFGRKGFFITPLTAPNWLVRFWARLGFDRESKAVVHRLGPELRFDNRKSIELLGMGKYINPERSVLDMAGSMVGRGMLGKAKAKRLAIERTKKYQQGKEAGRPAAA